MTLDDFSPSQHPAQVEVREAQVHQRAEEIRAELEGLSASAPDDTERMRLRLEGAGRKMLAAMVEAEAMTAVRNELVIEASERHRLPRSYVAQAAVLTRGRVQQLVTRGRDQRICPECGTTPPEPLSARRTGTSSGDGDIAFQPWIQTVKCPGCGTKLERNKETGPAHAWRVAR